MVSPSEDQALTLGLGISYSTKTIMSKNNPVKQPHVMVYDHEPSLALSLSGETYQTVERKVMIDHQEPPCSVSVASSLSNVVSVKRERESSSSYYL